MARSKLYVAKMRLLAFLYLSVFSFVVLQHRDRIFIKFYSENFTKRFRRILVTVFAPGTISCRNAVSIPKPITTSFSIACPDCSAVNTTERDPSQLER